MNGSMAASVGRLLILGANGQIARIVRKDLLGKAEGAGCRVQVTDYLRKPDRLQVIDPGRERVVDGDVNDYPALLAAAQGQDLVLADLGGWFEPMAANVVRAMDHAGVGRLIWITGLGLYHEVPGEFGRWVEESCGHEVMEDTRRAARIIEGSDLDYTIIRAAYMDDRPDRDYELTAKGEPYRGTTVSRASIADLIERVVASPGQFSRSSLGISRPGTDGDRPVWVD